MDVEARIHADNLTSVDTAHDGNCFYRALSRLTAGHERNHLTIRQSIADIIEKQGAVLEGIMPDCSFTNYIRYLRSPGNYEYVGEETVLAAAELFGCEVHVYCAFMAPQVYKPCHSAVMLPPILLGFF
jgi:hypothetical protein